MVAIPFMYFLSSFDFGFGFYSFHSILFVLVLAVSFITKRALFPFSSWLPAAIAAPTPISSLVHSSTLVTAGLYLIIRFRFYIFSNDVLLTYIILCRIFTSFYAGLNSLVEVDLKKIVALSTLSHLGFIGLAFSSGNLVLSFVHLIAHASFKSLLFICVGCIIVSGDHYQDSRYLSSSLVKSPFSSFLMRVSIFRLMGFCFISGFYSKDLILESLGDRNLSIFFLLIVYLNLFFTYVYTMRVFTCTWSFLKTGSYSLFVMSNNYWLIKVSLFVLRILSVLISSFYLWVSLPIVFVISLTVVKFYPFFLSLFVMIFFVISSYRVNVRFFLRKYVVYYFSRMIYLTPLVSSFCSNRFFYLVRFIFKSFESGFLNMVSNKSFSPLLILSSKIYNLSGFKSMFFVLLLIFMFLFQA